MWLGVASCPPLSGSIWLGPLSSTFFLFFVGFFFFHLVGVRRGASLWPGHATCNAMDDLQDGPSALMVRQAVVCPAWDCKWMAMQPSGRGG